jgi:hypothetical protein
MPCTAVGLALPSASYDQNVLILSAAGAKPKVPESETEVLAALALRGLTNRRSYADEELCSHQICIVVW